jgi:hypothetical protein
VHSVNAAICGWPALIEAVHDRLAPFATAAAERPDFSITFLHSDAPSLPPEGDDARPVYEFPDGKVAYRDAEGLLTISVGDRVRAHCWPGAGRAYVTVASPQPSDLWTLSHPVLTVTLMEMLKRAALFPVHAAGLALDGRGILLAGARRSGKSTLTMALTRRGTSFLTDDMVLVTEGPSGWHLRAFPDQVDLCDDTIDMFPELKALRNTPVPPEWLKRQVRPEQAFGVPIAWDVPAHTLIFPAIHDAEDSTLTPMSPEAALLHLAPNVLLTELTTSQRHFDALAGLIAQCRCYRLATGRNLDRAAALVSEIVAA